MLQIAICDDEQIEIDYLSDIVRNWADAAGTAVSLASFCSAENFLFAYDGNVDILLLDIQMGDMDGMTLARHLRGANDGIHIVFITGYGDFMADGYDVSALHYLMKPVDEARLFSVLDKAAAGLGKQDESLLVQTQNASVRVAHRDILYIEAFAHYVQINSKNGSFQTRANIGDIARELGHGFVRAHRSYIVGLRHVNYITKTDIVLDGGEKIPLSRRLYKDVNQAFIRFHM